MTTKLLSAARAALDHLDPAASAEIRANLAAAVMRADLAEGRRRRGLVKAKAGGVKFGRPSVSDDGWTAGMVEAWSKESPRPSYAVLARRLRVSIGTAHRLGKAVLDGVSLAG